MRKIKWINCAKGVAIIAVMIDHTGDLLQIPREVVISSYFSVSLFIILSGITSYLSNMKYENEIWYKNLWRCSKKILVSYCIATLVYTTLTAGSFDLYRYIRSLFTFSASGPLYFVSVYLQLMVVNKVLFNIIRVEIDSRIKNVRNAFVFFLTIVISSFSIKYTNILDIYGGGVSC